MFQHDFPDAVRHHYRSAGVDEDVLLYRGEFSYPGDERSFAGDVRFSWRPSPSIKVRGERPASPAAMHGLLSAYEDQGMWVEPGRVLIELADGVLPDQPGEPFVPRRALGESFQDERLDQEFGHARELEQVTFLIPTGGRPTTRPDLRPGGSGANVVRPRRGGRRRLDRHPRS